MTIKEENSRTLRTLLAFVPVALPHYCDDLQTQRRVGLAISACKQPPSFSIRTIWL